MSLFQPQVQMTFRYFHPKTGENVWKSKNVDQFQVLPNDKRSCKSSAFTVTCKDLNDGSQQYDISATLDNDVQLMYTVTRKANAKGWKLGQGEKGGFSYFGENPAAPVGHVVHRFWPIAEVSGMIVVNGRAIEARGQGMFVQAIQGMRPNLVASKWNFANFQSREQNGSSAVLMEFTTIPDYGKVTDDGAQRVPQTVTIGSIVCQGQLVAVVGATRAADGAQPSTHAEHETLTLDPETGYQVPQSIKYALQGPSLVGENATGQEVTAELHVELGAPGKTQGLVEKVDVLAEIPYMVKKLVNYVAGTKPYIYQTLNPVEMSLACPEGVAKALGLPETHVKLQGTLFEEHTFISA
ncbi:Putative cell survival pathways protein [Malassezia equina]|uniref:Cell survival pathways protein n=1 Tax=Malassezia equina TaxID=1381935 RepID=A0AAF0EBJ2_9BASI|nr:Putative cell survival pathways protein [Malassezia equina]